MILPRLFHHRWSIPVIATLYRRKGCRFVELVNALQVSRDSLTACLNDLMDQAIVLHNPGYGHPLRPEYILSPLGEKLGPACEELAARLKEERVEDVGLGKWSMPGLHTIGNGHHRFTEIKDSLVIVSPRALTQTLKRLTEVELVGRRIVDDYPPIPIYEATPRGALFRPALVELAGAK